jgi:hypothetical protein
MMESYTISLPEDILEIIWKTYYSQYVLPIIYNRKESNLYLVPITYHFNMHPLTYQPSGSANMSRISNIFIKHSIEYEYNNEIIIYSADYSKNT